MPVQSPMMCTAIYMKKYLNITDKLAFISPCIAKKNEIEYGLGSIYPMPGGLKENVYWLLGEDALVRQMEGEHHMYDYLRRNKDRIKGTVAIYNGFSHHHNCVHYIKDRAYEEKDKALELAEEVRQAHEAMDEKKYSPTSKGIVEKVNERADNLVSSIKDTSESISLMRELTANVEGTLKQIIEN